MSRSALPRPSARRVLAAAALVVALPQTKEDFLVGESAALRPGVIVTLLHPGGAVASRGSAIRREGLARVEDGFPNPT